MDHNTQSRKAAETMLANWRNGVWQNQNISKKIHFTKRDTGYPSPDGCFFEPRTNSRIAMEFKPEERESQRGLLTGVGQCIAYLNKHEAAYLVVPNAVPDNPKIGNYLEQTFKKSIHRRLPIGLITFNGNNFTDLKLRCDISSRIRLAMGSERGLDVNYWAAWRDTPPHAIYLLLKAAEGVPDATDRSEKIWQAYYFNQYVVSGSVGTLQDVPSNIKMWDGITPQIPLQGIKQKLRTMVRESKITEKQALLELKKKIDPNGIDNNYRDIKKNHYNFVNHLNLWDSNFQLTGYGKNLVEIGNKYGGNSEEFKKSLGHLILTVGRHNELIEDVRLAIANSQNQPGNMEEVRTTLRDYLEGKGYIKTNPNRTTTGVRKFLQSEFGVWGHLGILNQNAGNYFINGVGLSFNDRRINELVALGN